MDDIAKPHQRRITPLGNNNLNDLANKTTKTKGLPAKLDSTTPTAGKEGKPEIAARPTISQSNTNKAVKTYIYITEDIFDLGSFKYTDGKTGPRAKSLSDDDSIKPRASRAAYDAIKNAGSGCVKAGDPSDAVRIRTNKTGGPTTGRPRHCGLQTQRQSLCRRHPRESHKGIERQKGIQAQIGRRDARRGGRRQAWGRTALGQDDGGRHRRRRRQEAYEAAPARKLLRSRFAGRRRQDLRGRQNKRSRRQGIAQGRLRHLGRQAPDEWASDEKTKNNLKKHSL